MKAPKIDKATDSMPKNVSATKNILRPRPISKNMERPENNPEAAKPVKAEKRTISQVYPQKVPKEKRRAFVDLTNALESQRQRLMKGKGKSEVVESLNMPPKRCKKNTSQSGTKESDKRLTALHEIKKRSGLLAKSQPAKTVDAVKQECSLMELPVTTELSTISIESVCKSGDHVKCEESNLPATDEIIDSGSATSVLNTCLIDDDVAISCKLSVEPPDSTEPCSKQGSAIRMVDIDPDPNVVSEYAESIFTNMRKREMKFLVGKYLDLEGCQLNGTMRGILVDWLVEVQENFELYHETLYLAVKLVDRFLQVTLVSKEQLQLVGAAALMIACKIEERHPPPIEDFVFICDDAYAHCDFVAMEMKIFRALNFDMQTPISYTFLRRYARVAGASLEVLTLARYILETSLLEYAMVELRPSHIAAACLNLAFRMKSVGEWDATLEHHTGYKEEDILHTMRTLNEVIKSAPRSRLQTVRNKYSHPVFYAVATTTPLESL